MNELLKVARRERLKILESEERDILIFRENPLFDFFSDDERADAVLVENGSAVLIGESEVDESFHALRNKEACSLSPFYDYRKAKSCAVGYAKFDYILGAEKQFIADRMKEIRGIVGSALSSITTNDTEVSVSKSIRSEMAQSGIGLFYDPVVAFDANTKNIWNKPGSNNVKGVIYVEVASRCNGISCLFSDSFLTTNNESVMKEYQSILSAIEVLKETFVEGSDTSSVSQRIGAYRNEKLYLTTPLFPYSYHPIPGNAERVKTGDVAVFDLWVSEKEYSIRKKVTATAGSYRASVF